jgi:membrane-associated protein
LAGIVASLTSALDHLNSWLAIGLIAALVFGETALFVGFVLPGEAAVVLGGVLASRGHISLAILIPVVVIAAVTGPMVGYEIGRRLGGRLFRARPLARMPGAVDRTRTALRDRGGAAVFGGRFVAILRALMPAAAGAAGTPYRVFTIYNLIGGVLWGVGYCLLGYLAGAAYAAVERTVGTGLAIAVAVVVLAVIGVVLVRRHRNMAREGAAPPSRRATERSEGARREDGA